jgi:hypothetical protein
MSCRSATRHACAEPVLRTNFLRVYANVAPARSEIVIRKAEGLDCPTSSAKAAYPESERSSGEACTFIAWLAADSRPV